MRSFVGVVVALVVGIVIGAWQPRGEVLALRAKLEEAQKEAARAKRGASLKEIQGLLGADGGAPSGDDRRRGPPWRKREGTGEAPEAGVPQEHEGPENGAEGRKPPSPEEIDQEIAALKSGLDARRAHALQALAEQGELDEAQVGEVEAVFDDMNAKLKTEVDKFVADAQAEGTVERRDMMEFAANALDVVISTDDALQAALPEEQYDALDEELADPLSYVSGDTVAALAQIAALPGFGGEP